jgi:hypothetical protein
MTFHTKIMIPAIQLFKSIPDRQSMQSRRQTATLSRHEIRQIVAEMLG